MDKCEINKKIGKLLGFRAYGIEVNKVKNADFGWAYPEKFSCQQSVTPQRTLPDFVRAIELLIDFTNTVTNGGTIPKDYKTMADYDDLE